MIVTVWDLVSDKQSTHSFASGGLLDCWTEFFRCLKNSRIIRFGYVRKMIYFDLGHYECMSDSLWEYIEKGISIFILIDPT